MNFSTLRCSAASWRRKCWAASRPIIERLHRVLLRLRGRQSLLPRSGLGRAVEYALGQWPSLKVYLGDGLVEIDNNSCERKIRPTAVGKKNWLFVGEAEAGQRSAVIYTIIESCRAHGLDPYGYLREVLTRLPSSTNWQVEQLTPAAFAKARGSTRIAA
jgi:transposase